MPKEKKSSTTTVKSINETISFVQKNGVIIYPVYSRGFWFLEVNVNGTKKTYPKEIGKGSILKGSEFEDQLIKTYRFWEQKIIEKHGTDKSNKD